MFLISQKTPLEKSICFNIVIYFNCYLLVNCSCM